MVNLEKWEEVKFGDVKFNDKLKIVLVKKSTDTLTTTEVYKGKVTSVDHPYFWINGGCGWEDKPSARNTTTTIYRRKPEPFAFPHNLGAVIEGKPKHTSGSARRYVRLAGRWVQSDGSVAFEDALTANFENWTVLSKGVEL